MRFVSWWTRKEISGTCQWLLMLIMESRHWPTPWCPKLELLPAPRLEKPVSLIHGRMNRNAASLSSPRECYLYSEVFYSNDWTNPSSTHKCHIVVCWHGLLCHRLWQWWQCIWKENKCRFIDTLPRDLYLYVQLW